MKPRNRIAIKFGRTLRIARKSGGFTLPTLEKKSGVSKGLLSELENGRGNPTLFTIHSLANALRVSVTEFVR